MKKLVQQMTLQRDWICGSQPLFSYADWQISIGRMAKHESDERMVMKISNFAQRGTLFAEYHRMISIDRMIVSANSLQYITCILLSSIINHTHKNQCIHHLPIKQFPYQLPSFFTDIFHANKCGIDYVLCDKFQNMDLNQGVRPKKVYNVIEPNTNRVLQMRRVKMLKELQQRTQEQKLRKIKEEQERKNASLMKMREDQKRIELKRREEQQRRKREEESESKTLSGRFGHMINDLNTNTTNLEFTISGMDLRPTQIKILIANVQNNSSLKALTMCRKNLTDLQGCQLAQKLTNNFYLERLELQGNSLGPQTLIQISKLLKTNQSLRLVDLEGNRLVKGKEDKINYKGIQHLVQALKTNDTLLSLNLNATGLDANCSRLLFEMFQHNSTLILLDIDNNPEMKLQDVSAIQNALLRNKQEYDDERYMQFIERKRMRREQDISGVLLLNQQTKKLRNQAIELNIKTKKAQLDEEWTQFIATEQLKKQKEIVRMEKEAGAKKGKKKKK